MDGHRFDNLIRSLMASRRSLFGGGLAVASGWIGVADTDARKRKQRKRRKKIRRNAFGCVNVGNFCQNHSQCCSGICEGKKGKQKCLAHDQSTCQAGQDVCLENEVACTTTTGDEGVCLRTTGNAAYCALETGGCFRCARDADCVPACGAGAACAVCPLCAELGLETACYGHSRFCELPVTPV